MLRVAPKARTRDVAAVTAPALFVAVMAAMLAIALTGCGASEPDGKQVSAAGDVRSMGLLSESEGWILTTQELRITTNGGDSWKTITPDKVAVDTISTVRFLNPHQGWVLAAAGAGAGTDVQFVVARTEDGGTTWQTTPVNSAGADGDNLSLAGYLTFLDDSHGWAVLVGVTSSNFSAGQLFRTSDGGQTWEKLSIPIAAPVSFASKDDGVAAGGPAGDQLFITADGGVSWKRERPPLPSALASAYPVYGSPAYYAPSTLVIPVSFVSDSPSVGVLISTDGGQSWELTGSATIDQSVSIGAGVPSDVVDGQTVVVVEVNGSKIHSSADAGAKWSTTSPNGLPAGVVDVDFVSAEVGWALVQTNDCLTFKDNCVQSQNVYATTDAGQTWEEIGF